jgi:hypothetical protein
MFEIKGETNAKLLTSRYGNIRENRVAEILGQSERQLAASSGRPVVWVFAEEEAAQIVRRLFDTVRRGREFITVVHIPWTTSKR